MMFGSFLAATADIAAPIANRERTTKLRGWPYGGMTLPREKLNVGEKADG